MPAAGAPWEAGASWVGADAGEEGGVGLLTAKGRMHVPLVGLFVCLNDSQLICKIDCGLEMRGIAQARPLLISVEFHWNLAAE